MTSLVVNGRVLELVQGDITRFPADAIANAANSMLAGGGGVDGAIHDAGGPEIMKECREIGGCPTGQAVVTGAGRLPARYVIHAVGPIWAGGDRGEAELLRSAYRRVLELASERGCRTLALPSISTGAYGYPLDRAAPIALETVAGHLEGPTSLERVTLVLFTRDTLGAYARALGRLTPAGGGARPGPSPAGGPGARLSGPGSSPC